MIIIDPSSHTPPFEQLRGQLISAIEGGELPPGERLPTVRRLAGDLGLAPGTVARAYRELEAEGRIETRGRHGSFVCATDRTTDEARRAAAAFAAQARALRIAPEQALALVAAALRAQPAEA